MVYVFLTTQPSDRRDFETIPNLIPGLSFSRSTEAARVLRGDGSILKPGDAVYVPYEDGRVDRLTVVGTPTLSKYAKTQQKLEEVPFGFPLRILNLLHGAARHEPLPWKIDTLADLMIRTKEELLGIEGFGEKSFRLVKEVLRMEGFDINFGQMWLESKVDVLDLPERLVKALEGYNVLTIGDLVKLTRKKLLFATASETATKEIEEKLATLGIRLAD